MSAHPVPLPEARPAAEDFIVRFTTAFRELRHDKLHLLDAIYTPDVVFEDPLHRIEGLEALRSYFERMYEGVASIDFEFGAILEAPGEAMLTWTMRMRHRRLRPGEELALPGASHLRFGGSPAAQAHYHRDYFDAGAMIYERLPLVGGVVRAIRRRV